MERIRFHPLRRKVADIEEACRLIQNGMTVVFGGYTACGYPKTIAPALAARHDRGEELRFDLVSSSHLGPDVYEALGPTGIMRRCTPLFESRAMSGLANSRKVHYVEQQMGRLPRLLRSGAFGSIDVAVVEALGFTEEGHLIPTSSIGMVPTYLDAAKEIIVEINMGQPAELEGLHDIFLPGSPPNQRPIPLQRPGERIGEPFIRVNHDKIKYIVAADVAETAPPPSLAGEVHRRITDHLLNFLDIETARHFGGVLGPLQTGFGNLTNAIIYGLGESDRRDIDFFCGGLAQAHVELMEKGKVCSLSAGSLQLTPHVGEALRRSPELFRECLTLRNAEVSNSAETIGRIGLIALNSGIEVDIYGNVNSSHVLGRKVVNGIGGGAGFAQNAALSIVLIASTGKNGDISSIVPMVSHQDICEHDVDVVITEHGVADLRGKDDVERAEAVISVCADESYRESLAEYLDKAVREHGGHHPVSLTEAFSWHRRFQETGSMRLG